MRNNRFITVNHNQYITSKIDSKLYKTMKKSDLIKIHNKILSRVLKVTPDIKDLNMNVTLTLE